MTEQCKHLLKEIKRTKKKGGGWGGERRDKERREEEREELLSRQAKQASCSPDKRQHSQPKVTLFMPFTNVHT